MALNPMAGMISGFRHAVLGSTPHWGLIAGSMVISVGLFIGGLFIFRRMETRFADVI
jgi:lipopolysaccharide transport system permease protein